MQALSQETIELVKQVKQGLQRVINAKLEVLMDEVRSIDRKFQRREAKWRKAQSGDFLARFNTLNMPDFMWAATYAGVKMPPHLFQEIRDSIKSGAFKACFQENKGIQTSLF